jgi:hypothetical protein
MNWYMGVDFGDACFQSNLEPFDRPMLRSAPFMPFAWSPFIAFIKGKICDKEICLLDERISKALWRADGTNPGTPARPGQVVNLRTPTCTLSGSGLDPKVGPTTTTDSSQPTTAFVEPILWALGISLAMDRISDALASELCTCAACVQYNLTILAYTRKRNNL